MRLEAEMRQRELDRDEGERERARDLELARMQHEYRMAELHTKQFQIPNDQEKSFKVEVAAKLLPKPGSDQELDFYLVTFKKIAMLNKWPKEYWSAILQTQLKGKALRVLAELNEATIKDYDQLEKALLSAFELSSEHYRKKFREMKKAGHDNYTEFAFKLQSCFKRWLQSLNCYDNLENLRQTLMMEQFLETVPIDMRVWLVDQKPKNN